MTLAIANFNPDPDAPPSLDFMNPARGEISMSSNWARRLLETELDVNCMRPFVSNDFRRSYINRCVAGVDTATGKPMIQNRALLTNDTNATLRIYDWINLDTAVIKASKPRLKAAADLQAAGLVYQLPNGIAKTVLQFQQQSDMTGATVSMDGLRDGESDRPVFSTVNFPLPIIHKDFQLPLRQILASRTGFSPLDTTSAELAARRVAEQVEQFTLGVSNNKDLQGIASYTWAGASVQGYCNYSGRILYTLTSPTVSGWTPDTLINEILAMKKASQNANHYGPWKLYFGLNWDPYMDNDYKPTYNSQTLRKRLLEIDSIQTATTVDYMPNYDIVMVQQTSDVVRLVVGMDITTVQWESHGGMQMNFKVMCVMLPQLRGDIAGNTGIVHGSV